MRVPHKKSERLIATASKTWRWCIAVGLVLATILALHNASTKNAMAEDGDTHEKKFAVTIRRPAGPPRVDTGLTDLQGNRVTVACSTCHSTRKPDFENKSPADLKEFHSELKFSHGNVSCLSCHNDKNYDSLKLADGRQIEFTEVMTLCAQCHGPQKVAYDHGAHGGMAGHWDLTRGERIRNNCVDCHQAHAPQFPLMRPTFKPKDRFLEPSRTDH